MKMHKTGTDNGGVYFIYDGYVAGNISERSSQLKASTQSLDLSSHAMLTADEKRVRIFILKQPYAMIRVYEGRTSKRLGIESDSELIKILTNTFGMSLHLSLEDEGGKYTIYSGFQDPLNNRTVIENIWGVNVNRTALITHRPYGVRMYPIYREAFQAMAIAQREEMAGNEEEGLLDPDNLPQWSDPVKHELRLSFRKALAEKMATTQIAAADLSPEISRIMKAVFPWQSSEEVTVTKDIPNSNLRAEITTDYIYSNTQSFEVHFADRTTGTGLAFLVLRETTETREQFADELLTELADADLTGNISGLSSQLRASMKSLDLASHAMLTPEEMRVRALILKQSNAYLKAYPDVTSEALKLKNDKELDTILREAFGMTKKDGGQDKKGVYVIYGVFEDPLARKPKIKSVFGVRLNFTALLSNRPGGVRLFPLYEKVLDTVMTRQFRRVIREGKLSFASMETFTGWDKRAKQDLRETLRAAIADRVAKKTQSSPSDLNAEIDRVMHEIFPNAAMVPGKEQRNGGIDLTSDKAMQVQNNGETITFNIDPAMLQRYKQAPGLTPFIVRIEKMTDLALFLGVQPVK